MVRMNLLFIGGKP